jgi:hypothetical protein
VIKRTIADKGILSEVENSNYSLNKNTGDRHRYFTRNKKELSFQFSKILVEVRNGFYAFIEVSKVKLFIWAMKVVTI